MARGKGSKSKGVKRKPIQVMTPGAKKSVPVKKKGLKSQKKDASKGRGGDYTREEDDRMYALAKE